MPTVVECPSCHARANLDEDMVGRKIRCSRCSAVFTATPVDSRKGPHEEPPADSWKGSPEEPLLLEGSLPAGPPPERPRRPALPPRRPGSGLGLILCWLTAGCALIFALMALLLTLFRSSGGASSYDFSSPRAALTSELQIEVNGDFAARMEVQKRRIAPRLKEQLRTLNISREADWLGKKILFVSYDIEGRRRFETAIFEIDNKTGLWARAFVDEMQIQRDDPRLFEQMRSWRDSANFNPKFGPGGLPPGGGLGK